MASLYCSDVNPVQIDRARHVESRVVRQLGRLAEHSAGLGHCLLAEGLQLLLAEPVEVLLGRSSSGEGSGSSTASKSGVERTLRRGPSRRRPWRRSARGCGRSRRSPRLLPRCALRARRGAQPPLTASQIASTWSDSAIVERSASADSRPGSVSAVTSWPSARNAAATSSHAHAPSQNPGTRTIGAGGTPRP